MKISCLRHAKSVFQFLKNNIASVVIVDDKCCGDAVYHGTTTMGYSFTTFRTAITLPPFTILTK